MGAVIGVSMLPGATALTRMPSLAHREAKVDLEAGVQLALIGRYYERIGDHAVNIGERVRYMVTGWMPEHPGVARVHLRREG